MPQAAVNQPLPIKRIEWFLQLTHRLAIVAVLLLAGLMYTLNTGKPAYGLGWKSLYVADVAVVLGAILVVVAYRANRPIGQIVAVLLFSLLVAHAAGYLLLTGFDAVQWIVTHFQAWWYPHVLHCAPPAPLR